MTLASTTTRTAGMFVLHNFVYTSHIKFLMKQRHLRACACSATVKKVIMSTSSSASASVRSLVACLGCGNAIQRSSDRRNLTSATSRHVPLLKRVPTSVLERGGVAEANTGLESFIVGVDRSTAGYLRRKFLRMKKYTSSSRNRLADISST